MANSPTPWESYNGLPAITKSVIAVVAVVAAAGISYGIYKAIKSWKEASDQKASENATHSEINQLNSQGIHQTYPDSNYLSWADSIQKNIDGCNLDEVPTIQIIAQLKNDIDWLKLVAAFGIRKINGCGFVADRTVALQPALNWKLSDTTIAALNQSFFAAKGSKYRL